MMRKIKNFKKSALPQNKILGLFTQIYDTTYEANFPELSAVLAKLKSKMDAFDAYLHPIMGSEVTVDVADIDTGRDTYLVGFRYGVEFNARHFDPQRVAAAKEVQVVLSNPSYKQVYKEEHIHETSTIKDFVRELQQNHAAALSTMGLTEYVQKLAEANDAFSEIWRARANKRRRNYTFEDTLQARAEMEHAYDLFVHQLTVSAELSEDTPGTTPAMGGGGATGGMGGGTTPTMGDPITTYDDLISLINDYITTVTKDYSHDNDEEDETENEGENTENTTNTNEGGSENTGEENGGENGGDNTNTDPNQGDDNTPSANA